MADKGVVASATKRVKRIVRKAKAMMGLGTPKTRREVSTDKVKDAINRTANKAKGAVDEASTVVGEGADKAGAAVKQVGQKVKEAGQKLEDRGK